jgi:predicted SprT family Zn-dependent metalloprotease
MYLHHEEETGVRKSGVDWREVMKQMDELKGWKNART